MHSSIPINNIILVTWIIEGPDNRGPDSRGSTVLYGTIPKPVLHVCMQCRFDNQLANHNPTAT